MCDSYDAGGVIQRMKSSAFEPELEHIDKLLMNADPKMWLCTIFIIVLLLYYLSSYPGDDGNLPFFHSEPILLLNDFSDIWVKEVIFSLLDEEKPQQIHHFNAPLTYYIKLCTIHFTYLQGAFSFCS